MQKHSFAHTFCAKIKHGRQKKGAHQPPTLKKNITMVEPFAMASLPATLVAIATALFAAIAVACPPLLSQSPLPCRPHPPCCLPPSLPPQSSLPPLPLLLLAPHPCPPCCLPSSSPPQLLPPPLLLLLVAVGVYTVVVGTGAIEIAPGAISIAPQQSTDHILAGQTAT